MKITCIRLGVKWPAFRAAKAAPAGVDEVYELRARLSEMTRNYNDLAGRHNDLNARLNDLNSQHAAVERNLAASMRFLSLIGIEPGAVISEGPGTSPEIIARILKVSIDDLRAEELYSDAPGMVLRHIKATAQHHFIRTSGPAIRKN